MAVVVIVFRPPVESEEEAREAWRTGGGGHPPPPHSEGDHPIHGGGRPSVEAKGSIEQGGAGMTDVGHRPAEHDVEADTPSWGGAQRGSGGRMV